MAKWSRLLGHCFTSKVPWQAWGTQSFLNKIYWRQWSQWVVMTAVLLTWEGTVWRVLGYGRTGIEVELQRLNMLRCLEVDVGLWIVLKRSLGWTQVGGNFGKFCPSPWSISGSRWKRIGLSWSLTRLTGCGFIILLMSSFTSEWNCTVPDKTDTHFGCLPELLALAWKLSSSHCQEGLWTDLSCVPVVPLLGSEGPFHGYSWLRLLHIWTTAMCCVLSCLWRTSVSAGPECGSMNTYGHTMLCLCNISFVNCSSYCWISRYSSKYWLSSTDPWQEDMAITILPLFLPIF